MDIHIDAEQLKMFGAIVIAGALYGHYLYKKGLRLGWDDAMYCLSDAGMIEVDEDGEVKRISDVQYRKFRAEMRIEE
jgi:hypothetical protein